MISHLGLIRTFLSSITETGSEVFISPGGDWIFISWRPLTPDIDKAIQPS